MVAKKLAQTYLYFNLINKQLLLLLLLFGFVYKLRLQNVFTTDLRVQYCKQYKFENHIYCKITNTKVFIFQVNNQPITTTTHFNLAISFSYKMFIPLNLEYHDLQSYIRCIVNNQQQSIHILPIIQ